jgi:hypothetical protein
MSGERSGSEASYEGAQAHRARGARRIVRARDEDAALDVVSAFLDDPAARYCLLERSDVGFCVATSARPFKLVER